MSSRRRRQVIRLPSTLRIHIPSNISLQQVAADEEDEDSMNQTRRLGNDSETEEEEANDMTMDLDQRPGGGLEDQLAKKLVRYALSCEFSRTPIRRQAVREKGEVISAGLQQLGNRGC